MQTSKQKHNQHTLNFIIVYDDNNNKNVYLFIT